MYGENPILLETRRQVLEHAGVRVDAVTDERETRRLIAEAGSNYRALLICHTSSPAARNTLHREAGEAGLPVHDIHRLTPPTALIEHISQL